MTQRSLTGLFVAEGTSDAPLAEIVESLFLRQDVQLRLSKPDYGALLGRVGKDVTSRVRAGVDLIGSTPDIIVVHRDSDRSSPDDRRAEIEQGVHRASIGAYPVPIIPVRMTEAWILLDEQTIRAVSGNPQGKVPLKLPKIHEVETKADPKAMLAEYILKASELTGRRRSKLATRFPENRRRLLEAIDIDGPIAALNSWKTLLSDIESAITAVHSD